MHEECLPYEDFRDVWHKIIPLVNKYQLILAGGTALALHIGHRISKDLDFFTNSEFKTDSVISDIKKTGYPFSIISEGEGYIITEINEVKVSIFHYDYPFLNSITVYRRIPIAGVHDIAAMKVIAISQRGTKRDFVDLYFILLNTSFKEIAGHMVKRFRTERINSVHIGKSLVYFADADNEPEPEYIGSNRVDWEDIKSFFINNIKKFTSDIANAIAFQKNSPDA